MTGLSALTALVLRALGVPPRPAAGPVILEDQSAPATCTPGMPASDTVTVWLHRSAPQAAWDLVQGAEDARTLAAPQRRQGGIWCM